LTLDSNRLQIIAQTEKTKEQLLIAEHAGRWNLDTFAYGTAVLGGIGSGALIPGKKSQAVSALSGAVAGAAAGAAVGAAAGGVGAVYGAAIGAVIGGVGGALQ
jgi:hypothetical protein